ncbi:uncharacterized protein LOC122261683 isoform X2 [Penaeus japonicus]|uniref:uncharacterized protein LOC122261683 isoform X2 n=1 Tax=Penaeus japonicus TaxID=27405 RepID=UPI001C70B05F|nr:uncharacterized protein LOC122261683 isoform X2 [Penaeus japonicus]
MAATEDWNPRSLSTFSTFGGGQGSPPLLGGQNSPPLLGLNGHTNGGLHINSSGGGVGGVSVLVSPSKTNGAVTVNGSAPPELLASPDVIAHCHKPAHTLGPEIVSHVPKPIGMPVAPPSIEGVVRPRHTHSKSLVGDELQPLPAPRHAHSRSLVDTMDLIPPKSPDGVDSTEINLFLGPADRRFGFSVVGGVDEGFPPRIDEIAKGEYASVIFSCVGRRLIVVVVVFPERQASEKKRSKMRRGYFRALELPPESLSVGFEEETYCFFS